MEIYKNFIVFIRNCNMAVIMGRPKHEILKNCLIDRHGTQTNVMVDMILQ